MTTIDSYHTTMTGWPPMGVDGVSMSPEEITEYHEWLKEHSSHGKNLVGSPDAGPTGRSAPRLEIPFDPEFPFGPEVFVMDKLTQSTFDQAMESVPDITDEELARAHDVFARAVSVTEQEDEYFERLMQLAGIAE